MEIVNIQFLLIRLRGLKSFLPKELFSRLEQLIRKPSPTREQLVRINRLGESVGLQKNEIVAAFDAPSQIQGIPSKNRLSMYFALLVVTVIVTLGILFFWASFKQDPSPITTYTPGSLYGTVRPEDFSIGSYIELVV